MNFVYLHGFASGPRSRKAQYFVQQFADRGITLHTPDLNLGDFSTITLSKQLNHVQTCYGHTPTCVIGSSLGGLLAVLWAIENPIIERLVLLAPAFQFDRCFRAALGNSTMATWQQTGYRSFYHYDLDRELPLAYQFIEDASQYSEENLHRSLPILIIHGNADDVVDPSLSMHFAADRRHVEVSIVSSDHSLGNVTPYIWQRTATFLPLSHD